MRIPVHFVNSFRIFRLPLSGPSSGASQRIPTSVGKPRTTFCSNYARSHLLLRTSQCPSRDAFPFGLSACSGSLDSLRLVLPCFWGRRAVCPRVQWSRNARLALLYPPRNRLPCRLRCPVCPIAGWAPHCLRRRQERRDQATVASPALFGYGARRTLAGYRRRKQPVLVAG